MYFHKFYTILLLAILFLGCEKNDSIEIPNVPVNLLDSMYFPPIKDTVWEKVPTDSIKWNKDALQPLNDFLIESNTKSFMVLINGRIELEEYFNGHTDSTSWEWNSAGKTLVSAMVGIAQQEGYLTINDPVSKYLGSGWTSEPIEKEKLITIRHLLTMTTGLNDSSESIAKENLTYIADAGTRWSYNNVFRILEDVVAAATHQDFDTYFNTKVKEKIGMDGDWSHGNIFNIYHSTTRSMARFGLLALNKGKWEKEQIIDDAYFNNSINSSQTINPAYGYLWWLNGKAFNMRPGSQNVYQGPLTSTAPPDMYAAKGAAGQLIYVLPSQKMVIIRMAGRASQHDPNDDSFENTLWDKMNALLF